VRVVIIEEWPEGCQPRPGFVVWITTRKSSFSRRAVTSRTPTAAPVFRRRIIKDESSLLLQTPESLFDRFRLDVRVYSEAVSIDPTSQIVIVRNLKQGNQYELSYDYLILSPGALPVIPPIPGIERALPLRTVEDVERMTNAVVLAPTRGSDRRRIIAWRLPRTLLTAVWPPLSSKRRTRFLHHSIRRWRRR